MEKVTIQEASYRLNLSQAGIRECIRNGELKAQRELGPHRLPLDGGTSRRRLGRQLPGVASRLVEPYDFLVVAYGVQDR